MKRIVAVLASGLFWLACAPEIPNTPATKVVVARFDPSASPAVVSSPNDLATDRTTGLLSVPIPATASEADKAFYGFLNTLNGFPTTAGASTTFDGELVPESVTQMSVRVLDKTDNFSVVTTTVAYSKQDDFAAAPGKVSIAPPMGGWKPGHTYSIAIIGGSNANAVKGTDNRPVVGSATWSFIRSEGALADCHTHEDGGSECHTTTEIIPSAIKDDAEKRLEDQSAKATLLEQLRLKYKPALDALKAGGVPRADVALLWEFRINDLAQPLFNPASVPPAVPSPNDLAIDPVTKLVKAPVNPAASAAEQEFTTDYLNTLNGFPPTAGASAFINGGEVDPASINKGNVFALVVKGEKLSGDPTVTYDATARKLTVSPPGGSWGKTRTLAIVIVGGTNGVKAVNGKPIAAMDAWGIVRSAGPLVDCMDLTSADCKALLTAAPLTLDQLKGLEGLRRAYAPILDALEAGPKILRKDVALLWVFSTVDQAELTFDPANSIIPFPNVLLMANPTDGGTNTLKLPVPAGASAAQAQLIGGLNTLDGFSTTAPAVSEASDPLGALDRGNLDPATFLDGGTGVVKLAAGGLQPKVNVCVNCASSKSADGGSFVKFADGGMLEPAPEQLQFVPEIPLQEATTYAPFVTTAVKSKDGKRVMAAPAFALLRSKAPLLENGKSTLSVLSDAQAQALEPVRLGLKGIFDALEAGGLPRKNLALAWGFKTQSILATLNSLQAAPTGPAGAVVSADPTFLADITVPTRASLNTSMVPNANIGKIYTGNLVTAFILTNTGGTLNPNASALTLRKAPFVVAVPTGTPPTGGWPIVVYGHGLTRNRNDSLLLANSLAAKGFATVAMDVVFHGDRADCRGSASVLGAGATDDDACSNPATMACNGNSTMAMPGVQWTGRCVLKDRTAATSCTTDADCFPSKGQCFQLAYGGDNKCEEGSFKPHPVETTRPAIAHWNFLNLTNFFATRDNFRYVVLDFATLIRTLKEPSFKSTSLNGRLIAMDPNSELNATNINYAGQSLGTFSGNLSAAVNPDFQRVALNVPGSDQVEVLLTAPSFSAQKTGFLAGLAGLGLTPGSPAFDQFLTLAQTIIDPSDSRNVVYANVNSTVANRKVYLQYIEGDETLPNSGTLKLIAAANQTPAKQAAVFKYVPPMNLAGPDRHGYLLNYKDVMSTVKAQNDLATFLSTGVAP